MTPQSPPSPLYGATSVRLAVIVPVYGNWDDTLDCLRMLGDQSTPEFHVILADDGSPEPPPDAIESFPFVTYMRNPHAGFAAICNAAAVAACAKGFTHLLLLNNDTAFGRDFIATWISKVTDFPQAILGPMIYEFDRPHVLWFSGGPRSIASPFMRARLAYTEQTAVDLLTGCVLLIPTDAWQRLNGFESRFVTYYEDFDLVLRAREAGIAVFVVVDPELRVMHKVSRTTLRDGSWPREYRMLASRLLFIRRRYGGVQKAVCLLLFLPHIMITCVARLPMLPSPGLLWKAIREGLGASR